MKGIQASGEVYVDTTFIGKLDGNGHKITDAAVPLLRRTANSYIADIEISDTTGTKKDWVQVCFLLQEHKVSYMYIS